MTGQGAAPAAGNLLGPYEWWMFGPGRTYDLPGLRLEHEVSLSAVAECADGFDPAALSGTKGTIPGPVPCRYGVPTLYAPPDFRPNFLPFALMPAKGTAPARLADIENLRPVLGPSGVGAAMAVTPIGFRLNFPILTTTLDPSFPAAAPAAQPGAEPPEVIVAIIDHGIPFAHRAFRHGATTRIDYCWSQTADTDRSGAVLFGREFTGAAIDALVQRHSGDEEAIYREAGVLSRPGQVPMPLDRAHSHGAHVLGTLAGHWPAASAARARIIAVDLPASSVWETSGFGKDMFMLAAMHYIFERASRIGDGRLPLVVNLSYGYSAGPHDGSGSIDRAFEEMIAHRRQEAPTALVMPAGNMFQDKLHAVVTPAQFVDGVAELDWFVPPDDRTSTFLELWYPAHCPGLRVEVLPPGATAPANPGQPALTDPGFRRQDLLWNGRVVGQFSLDVRTNAARQRAMAILAPTAPKASPGGLHGAAPAGRWRLRLVADQAAPPPTVEAWVQCDTSYGQGKTGARQSYFQDRHDRYGPQGALSNNDAPGAVLRRFGSLNGMAAGASIIVVAGYDAHRRGAAPYSSAGARPAGEAGADLVDCAAPAERSKWVPGILSIGTRSGSSIAQSGTSSSAPVAARCLAETFLEPGSPPVVQQDYLARLAAHPAAVPVTGSGPADPDGTARLGSFRLDP